MLSRRYRHGVVNRAIEKAKAIRGQDALKKVEKKKQQRPVVVVHYNPGSLLSQLLQEDTGEQW